MCDERKEKGFWTPGFGRFLLLIYLLSATGLVSLMYLEKAVAAIFLGHSNFHSWYFQLLLGRLEAELHDIKVKAKLC